MNAELSQAQSTVSRRKIKRFTHSRGGAAVTINMTIPSALYPRLQTLIQVHAYSGPSDFFQACIRANSGTVLRPNALSEISNDLHGIEKIT